MSIKTVFYLQCDSCGEESTHQFYLMANATECCLANGWTQSGQWHRCPSCSEEADDE
jgi:hypothetical protein